MLSKSTTISDNLSVRLVTVLPSALVFTFSDKFPTLCFIESVSTIISDIFLLVSSAKSPVAFLEIESIASFTLLMNH